MVRLTSICSRFTPDPETLEIFREVVDYVASLPAPAYDGFWLPCTSPYLVFGPVQRNAALYVLTRATCPPLDVGHILSSLTSSLIRLSLATTLNPTTPGSISHSPSLPLPPHHHQHPHAHHPHPSPTPSTTLRASPHTNPLVLLSRLIATLHTAYERYDWDLAEAALTRAENVAACLRPSVEEFGNVVAALERRFDLAPVAAEPMGGSASTSGGSTNDSGDSGVAPMDLEPEGVLIGMDAGGMDAGMSTGGAEGGGMHDVGMEAGWNIDLSALGMDWVDEIIAGVGSGNGWAFGMGTGLKTGPGPGLGVGLGAVGMGHMGGGVGMGVGMGMGMGGVGGGMAMGLGGGSSLNGALGPSLGTGIGMMSDVHGQVGMNGGPGYGGHGHGGYGHGGGHMQPQPHIHQLQHPQQPARHSSQQPQHPSHQGYGIKVNLGGGPGGGGGSAPPAQQQARRSQSQQQLHHSQFVNQGPGGGSTGSGSGGGGHA